MKIGIVGYGNLAKGAECALQHHPDMELAAVFTRRDPAAVQIRTPGVGVYSMQEILQWEGKLDVLLLCGGSATDLPVMTPELARHFNVVDSFDTHADIPTHFAKVQAAAAEGGHTAIISAGWDPGMFSLNRLYGNAILPQGKEYTFWGPGVSQGHSDAVRRIPGVLDARQYTLPVKEALIWVREGEMPNLTPRQKHTRLCYVVAEEGADQAAIEKAICTMPKYFADYDTQVEFITAEQMETAHRAMYHGGHVLCSANTGWDGEHSQVIEYTLTLDSNPEFTASVLVACARAAQKMHRRGQTGCYTMFDIAPADLSAKSREELMATLL